ncbi:RNA polymerase sigma factor [Arenimonas sp.]|uniref:RNA polymerase sigma factor n=1 Tax=Arenimonas sp. TaxID=1872635 RepID=UPI002E33D44A|nr:RNA polymerase sigma factor [Arenimonas sp.]HEX4854605.1 RNA polymerase sigma factor [Arenimonas sp.]
MTTSLFPSMLMATSPAVTMQNQAWLDDLDAARAGNRLALERVLTRSRQDLRRYAEHHCVVNDVEDAVQESLFTASRRLVDLRQLECFASWLFRIVKRECNRLKRGMRTFLHEPITEDIAAVCMIEHRGLARDLAAALESLPAHYREIVLLRDLEGLTIEELAERLGLTREATKARLHRARSLAREYLKH